MRFHRKWKALFPALFITAAFFMVWDSLFTAQGIWGFNQKYLMGIMLHNLPMEEVLFFICIPYCSVFTYEVLNYFIKKDHFEYLARHSATILVYVLVALAIRYHDRAYTFYTSIFTAAFLLLHLKVLQKPYWGRLVLAYTVILVPFFIVNGILTGTGLPEPVVWYNDAENMGIRLLTIPLEDTIYGFLLIGMNITLFEYFRK